MTTTLIYTLIIDFVFIDTDQNPSERPKHNVKPRLSFIQRVTYYMILTVMTVMKTTK